MTAVNEINVPGNHKTLRIELIVVVSLEVVVSKLWVGMCSDSYPNPDPIIAVITL